MAETSVGSTQSAAPPAISGSELVHEVNTGVPEAIDSMTGRPNPSISEANKVAWAPLYSLGKSCSSIKPKN